MCVDTGESLRSQLTKTARARCNCEVLENFMVGWS